MSLPSIINPKKAADVVGKSDALKTLVQHDITNIASKLYSRSIISSDARAEAINPQHIASIRAVNLLSVVEGNIRADHESQVFPKFVKILQSESLLKSQAKKLVESYLQAEDQYRDGEQDDRPANVEQEDRIPKLLFLSRCFTLAANWRIALSLIVMFFGMGLLWNPWSSPQYLRLNCTLRTPSIYGRSESLAELSRVIDFSNTSFKIINIIGPPGVGKSTLARHLVNNNTLIPTVLCYDLKDFPERNFEQAFGQKILGIQNATLDDLVSWTRNQTRETLIVLDNCDKYINQLDQNFIDILDEVIGNSQYVKFLLTSPKEPQDTMSIIVYSYSVEPLNVDNSVEYLDSMPSLRLNGTEKKAIAEVTDGFPLALKVLGSLFLEARIKNRHIVAERVIAEMNRTDYNFTHLTPVQRVINISYSYLDDDQQEIGRYLSYFPGSFDEPAVEAVLNYSASSPNHVSFDNTVGELISRSLLEYDENVNRFNFHGLIQKFFANCKDDLLEKHRFNITVQKHFGSQLQKSALTFVYYPGEAIQLLDIDWHNYRYFLGTLEHSHDASYSTYFHATYSLEVSLGTLFLYSRFSPVELIGPVDAVTNFLAEELVKSNEMLAIFVEYVYHLASITENLKGVTQATWQYRKREELMTMFAGTVEYMKFCNNFTQYESSLYYYDCVHGATTLNCPEQMYYVDNEAQEYFTDRKPGGNDCYKNFDYDTPQIQALSKSTTSTTEITTSPSHYDMGVAYHSKGDRESSASHFKQALAAGTYSDIAQELHMLLYLKKFYDEKGYEHELEEIRNELNKKFDTLSVQNSYFVYKNIRIYYTYIEDFLREKLVCPDKTAFEQYLDLSELIFDSALERGDKNPEIKFDQVALVADILYLEGNFLRAAKIASYTLNRTSPEDVYFSMCSSLILSKSLYALGNYSEASSEFIRTVDFILSFDATDSADWVIQGKELFLKESCRFLVKLGKNNEKCAFHFSVDDDGQVEEDMGVCYNLVHWKCLKNFEH